MCFKSKDRKSTRLNSSHTVISDAVFCLKKKKLAACINDPRVCMVRGDVADPTAVATALRDAELVFHLAARADEPNEAQSLEDTFRSNVLGTFNVLRAAHREGVQRVVFTSSCEAYGHTVELPVDEVQPLLAASTYGASKTAGEAYCRAFRRMFDLQTVVLRLSCVYGPRARQGDIATWVARASSGQDVCLTGNGKQVRDYIWVGQVVEALRRA